MRTNTNYLIKHVKLHMYRNKMKQELLQICKTKMSNDRCRSFHIGSSNAQSRYQHILEWSNAWCPVGTSKETLTKHGKQPPKKHATTRKSILNYIQIHSFCCSLFHLKGGCTLLSQVFFGLPSALSYGNDRSKVSLCCRPAASSPSSSPEEHLE